MKLLKIKGWGSHLYNSHILGHSDVWITMRYGHATPASKEAAVRALGDDAFPSSLQVVRTDHGEASEALAGHDDKDAARS